MMQQAVEHYQDAYLGINLTKPDPANRRPRPAVQGGPPSSPASSVPAEEVHPSLNRRSTLAPARADAGTTPAGTARQQGPDPGYDLWSASG